MASCKLTSLYTENTTTAVLNELQIKQKHKECEALFIS